MRSRLRFRGIFRRRGRGPGVWDDAFGRWYRRGAVLFGFPRLPAASLVTSLRSVEIRSMFYPPRLSFYYTSVQWRAVSRMLD